VVVQDIEIKPKNTKFQRQLFYSVAEQVFGRGPLSTDYEHDDISANLRALVEELKYGGNMSATKIGEFLENFDVQVSAEGMSNFLTRSAEQPFSQRNLFFAASGAFSNCSPMKSISAVV